MMTDTFEIALQETSTKQKADLWIKKLSKNARHFRAADQVDLLKSWLKLIFTGQTILEKYFYLKYCKHLDQFYLT